MGRKTIKSLEEEIEKLKERLNLSFEYNLKLERDLTEIRRENDTEFERSTTYLQMKKEIDRLKNHLEAERITAAHRAENIKKMESVIAEQEKEIALLRASELHIPVPERVRYKGRPPISEEKKQQIITLRQRGYSLREIASAVGVSLTCTQKIAKSCRQAEENQGKN